MLSLFVLHLFVLQNEEMQMCVTVQIHFSLCKKVHVTHSGDESKHLRFCEYTKAI